MSSGLQRWLPFLQWWPRVARASLRADLIAGLTGSLILVPQGVAFATIAGMPPEYGLYAAMLPAIVAALWGSSWHLVSGPTTAISIVVFATMSPLAEAGSAHYVQLVLTLTFLVGIFQLLLGGLRLGTLVNFVSHTVVVGFTAGAAVLIAISQVKNFFGIALPRGASVAAVLQGLAQQAQDINPFVTSVSLFTVVCCVAARRWWPRVPHMIVGMVSGSLLAYAMNQTWGLEHTGVGSIGALRIGFPPLSSPDFDWQTIQTLAPIAMAVALLALTEAVSILARVCPISWVLFSRAMPPAAPSTAAASMCRRARKRLWPRFFQPYFCYSSCFFLRPWRSICRWLPWPASCLSWPGA